MNVTEFDKMTISDNTQLLKALITHLDFETARLLATYIRLTELKLTMEYYSKNRIFAEQKHKETDFKCILDDIKKYCSSNQQNMINNISQMINIYSMYSSFSDINKLLNPEQMDIFNKIMEDCNEST